MNLQTKNRKGIGSVDKSRIKQEIGDVNLRRPVGFGEQVVAGWPSWLSVVAREAIHGWIPLRAESFEKLEKVRVFSSSFVILLRFFIVLELLISGLICVVIHRNVEVD